MGRTYRLLRERLAYRAARAPQGSVAGAAGRDPATTAGAVLVDGERIGDVEALGPEGVLVAVRGRRLPTPLS